MNARTRSFEGGQRMPVDYELEYDPGAHRLCVDSRL